MTTKRINFEDIIGLTFSKIENKDNDEVIFTVNAYDPNDFELFSFEGWISLPINNRQIYFKRHKDPTYPWHFFSWKDLFRNNWKYIGLKKKDFVFNYWYVVRFDFVKKIVTIKELL